MHTHQWSMRAISTALVCTSIALFTTPATLFAQEQPADEQAQFDAEAQRANTLYNEGKFDEAIQAFEQAYTIKPEPNILYNIGRIHEKQGNFEQATIYYEKFVNEPDIALPARQDALARLKTLTEVLELRKKSDAPESSKDPEAQPDTIEPQDNTPPDGEPDKPTPPIGEPEPEPPSMIGPIAVMGVGAAGLVVGGVFGVLAGQTHTQYQNTNDLEERRTLASTGRSQSRIADVSMITGGALLVGGGTWFILRQRPSRERGAITLAPAISTRAQGVHISVRF